MQRGGELHPRLSLGCVILADPRIVIVDEAISSVDAEVVSAVTGVVLMGARIAVSLTMLGAIVGIPLVFSGSC